MPASARADVVRRSSTTTPATPASPAAPPAGGSLLSSTAHLFGDAQAGVVRRLLDQGGPAMPSGSAPDFFGQGRESWELEHRGGSIQPAEDMTGWTSNDGYRGFAVNTADADAGNLPGDAMDALVDAVVERIEARVVDELERRGRRQDWGVF
ncbi:hypothetical protein FE634_22080 [Nocardioides dongxiaopingii]|uniref:hypothetical protein n=1 Tax=Nocardioides sp. S-1144 TaxID=2582905 RepID=UPI00116318C4|nr:hypothetical protein [Nocardioides sp. S-1144]QDH11154.1 hypothetical protein FE634_22080 [Nocardioides sp. S-1144]